MFLMKYFVSIAASETSSISFLLLDVAEYLENVKRLMLEQVTGKDLSDGYIISIDDFLVYISSGDGIDRFAHPHLPDSYIILSNNINDDHFDC